MRKKSPNKKSKKRANIEIKEIQKKTIETLVEIFPDLKDRKQDFIDVICEGKIPKVETYVLRKFMIGQEIFYRDSMDCILDKDGKMVGICRNYDDETKNVYYFHQNISQKLKKLQNNLTFG